MRVYIAEMTVAYEPGDIIGVYSTREKAEAAIAAYKAQHSYYGDDYPISEYEVDEGP